MAKPPSPTKLAADPATPVDRLRELYLDVSLQPKLVTNPSLPSELLRQLGSSPEAGIRKKVAVNPNTPSDVLLQLATQFPEQLLENPIFPLLLLENPLLLSDMPLSTLKSLLKREQVPVEFLAWASDHQDATVIEALLVNPGVTRAMLERALAKHPELAEQITNHASWEGGEVDLEAVVRDAILDLPDYAKLAIAADPQSPLDRLMTRK